MIEKINELRGFLQNLGFKVSTPAEAQIAQAPENSENHRVEIDDIINGSMYTFEMLGKEKIVLCAASYVAFEQFYLDKYWPNCYEGAGPSLWVYFRIDNRAQVSFSGFDTGDTGVVLFDTKKHLDKDGEFIGTWQEVIDMCTTIRNEMVKNLENPNLLFPTIPPFPKKLKEIEQYWKQDYVGLYGWISKIPFTSVSRLRLKTFADVSQYLHEKGLSSIGDNDEYEDNFTEYLLERRHFSVQFEALPSRGGTEWIDFYFHFFSENKVTTEIQESLGDERSEKLIKSYSTLGFIESMNITWEEAVLLIHKLCTSSIPPVV